MSDNVFIFGAGVSFDAGIPLMGNFMDVMWRMAQTGRHVERKLTSEEMEVLAEAIKVREELDGYHGRVAVDVWNIEDLLSILSMNAMAGGTTEKRRLAWMVQAIALVIEVTGKSRHDGDLTKEAKKDGPSIYQSFWKSLIAWCRDKDKSPPVIITFNYDLILERALLQGIIGTDLTNQTFPWHEVQVDYGSTVLGLIRFAAKHQRWEYYNESNGFERKDGVGLQNITDDRDIAERVFKASIFKLHGSLNFPQGAKTSIAGDAQNENLVTSLDNPAIMPPVFNKATNPKSSEIWSNALSALRQCKNLIICGYSLPASDVYMQYFFKSALGPNQDLSNIYVFDPVLFDTKIEQEADALRMRYASNFSPALKKRISFIPLGSEDLDYNQGTFDHLVYLLGEYPERILFS